MFLLLVSCVQELANPNLGDCAIYPEDRYDYGQMEIGSCISGPTDFQFIGSEDDLTFLVSNANPYLNFTGGSLLAFSWSDLAASYDTVYTHEIDTQSFDLPSFAAPIEVIGTENLMVGVRYSEGASNRVQDDSVFLFDIRDPQTIQQKTAGAICVSHLGHNRPLAG